MKAADPAERVLAKLPARLQAFDLDLVGGDLGLGQGAIAAERVREQHVDDCPLMVILRLVGVAACAS